MHRKVAVENNLHSVGQYFHNNGFQVDLFDDSELDTIGAVSNYDAIIISGMNQNFMGVEDVFTNTPIVSVEGMTPEEVFNRIVKHNNLH